MRFSGRNMRIRSLFFSTLTSKPCTHHARALAAVVMALTCGTSTLAAQGRQRGGAPDQSAPVRERVAPVLWNPEQIFPLAVAHASDLKLTDEQRVQIETIASKLRASNAPLLEAIDTLRPPQVQLPDPNNPTALTARAIAELIQWQWRATADDLRQLEQLHANAAQVWHLRAIFFDYMALPQFTGPAEEKAVQLDPLSYIDRYNLALYRMLEKRYNEAARISAEAWALQPAQPELQMLNVQIALGRNDMASAERTLASLVAQDGENSPNTVGARFYIDVAKKNFAQARKTVNAVAASFPASGIPATDLGTAYAMTDDVDSAIKWYRRAFELRDPLFMRVSYANPQLTKLYADPRWKALRATPEARDWEEARLEIAKKSQSPE